MKFYVSQPYKATDEIITLLNNADIYRIQSAPDFMLEGSGYVFTNSQ
jgi:hypothetical protein